jgi:hypothetical protein
MHCGFAVRGGFQGHNPCEQRGCAVFPYAVITAKTEKELKDSFMKIPVMSR